jgi:DNA-binding GntR family transcriptional regulator
VVAASPGEVETPSTQLEWPVIGDASTLSEKIYQAVRERILSGQIPPEGSVREEQIAELMGVSRTPVREALSRLAIEGFLERIPRRGFRVPAQALEELVDLYPVLQALEVLAAEIGFPRVQTSDLDRLENLNASFARAVAESNVAGAIELNDLFHHTLASLSGNATLCRILEDLRNQVRRLEVLDFSDVMRERAGGEGASLRPDEWVKQHAALLSALRAGDHKQALKLLRDNRSLVFQAKVGEAKARQERSVPQ